jgi:MurNAc alpha-1-phosphate uridylyltransferase
MKAMILAAGRGERMRPLTDTTPKPLLAMRGKPLIQWTIEALARAGLSDIVINHAHLGHMVEEALGDGSRFGVRIRYSPEGTALETAGGIVHAMDLLGPAPFVVVNGDVLSDFNFSNLTARELGKDLAHLVLVPNPPHHPQGDFSVRGSRIVSSGAPGSDQTPKWTFSGIGLYSPALFSGIADGVKAPLAPLLFAAAEAGRLGGELYSGAWHDVGTPERYAELNT